MPLGPLEENRQSTRGYYVVLLQDRTRQANRSRVMFQTCSGGTAGARFLDVQGDYILCGIHGKRTEWVEGEEGRGLVRTISKVYYVIVPVVSTVQVHSTVPLRNSEASDKPSAMAGTMYTVDAKGRASPVCAALAWPVTGRSVMSVRTRQLLAGRRGVWAGGRPVHLAQY